MNGIFTVAFGNRPVPRLKAVMADEPARTTLPVETSLPIAAAPPGLPLLLNRETCVLVLAPSVRLPV